ncbi:hypothetical protein SAMN05421595_3109 [Austwickia chelonae]|uniref:Uncharacterized protein n=1 Tax=Austwickia chelonae NBRC 105200 TaxID=1184607 RepID=K6VRF7_9MICO|nr:hypothetical protein [Austwickia chelonae]GAB79349.1 hypothetical protein AUCHE_24_00020 [Austwickia chelonae NBRC 105200]SEW44003.1 hypothetical protein SAMN05421595_3109 [Austwickia chelonae]
MTSPETAIPHPASAEAAPTVRGRAGRTTGAFLVLVAGALALAGCGGGDRPVTQEKVRGALVETGDIPGQNWSAGEANEVAPEREDTSVSEFLNQSEGVSEACRNALAQFNAQLGKPSAYAQLTFSQPSESAIGGRELSVTVRGYQENFPELPDPQKVVGTCPSFDLSREGQQLSVKLRKPTYETKGSSALGMDITMGTEKISLDMVRAPQGGNLVSLSLTGVDEKANKEVLEKVLTKQLEKVKSSAG